jgi:hypothetical protein
VEKEDWKRGEERDREGRESEEGDMEGRERENEKYKESGR